jgi:hydroxypyruvate isomerase
MSSTVIKGNWKQIPKSNAAKATQVKAHMKTGMDYYANRPDQDGARGDRVAFTETRDAVSREEVHQEIDQAQARYAYRMVMSPNPEEKMTEAQLREWTRTVMREAQTMHRIETYTAVAHTRQTDQPHVHVLAISPEKFNAKEFEALRAVGDREQARILERDGQTPTRGREVERQEPKAQGTERR